METDQLTIDVALLGVKTKESWPCSLNTNYCIEDQTIEVFNESNNKRFAVDLR